MLKEKKKLKFIDLSPLGDCFFYESRLGFDVIYNNVIIIINK